MTVGYTRQSSLEIVDGEIAFASDFNNEFDAIQAAFHATTGHDHSGATGKGPVLVLGTSTSGVLSSARGGLYNTTVDPTATDDTPDFLVGGTWVNTTNKTSFICLDTTSTAAVWQQVLTGRTRVTTTAPVVGSDIAAFYQPGSVWINTTPTLPQPYIAQTNTAGAATWLPLMNGRVTNSTSNPGVNDDGTVFHKPGSIWLNTSTPLLFTNISNGTGAASWKSVMLGKITATTTSPGVSDDGTVFHAPGSIWINTSTSTPYVNISSGTGAANWVIIGSAARMNPVSMFLGLL